MLRLIFLVTLLNLVIAKPSVPVEEEELPGPRDKDMEYDFEMEAEVPKRQEVSERQFKLRQCKKENEPCDSLFGLSRCCNTDQECQVCKPGGKRCKLNGLLCIPCLEPNQRTCQPKTSEWCPHKWCHMKSGQKCILHHFWSLFDWPSPHPDWWSLF